MALVDYSDSEDDSKEHRDKRTKKPCDEQSSKGSVTTHKASALPPLPQSFHDLYTANSRASTSDNPALHDGRTRQTPHVAGNWPSHIYIDWRPSQEEHTVLQGLVTAISSRIAADEAISKGDSARQISGFLASDLGAPLPLHISLSRPFVLRTEEKAQFVEALHTSLQGSFESFDVSPWDLIWYRSADSNRSFLVLRVAEDTKAERANPSLSSLLSRCNKLLQTYDQPALYHGESAPSGADGGADNAFHVSVAWSFLELDSSIDSITKAEYALPKAKASIEAMRIHVDAIKVKVGNVVTNIPLKKGRGNVKGTLHSHESNEKT